MSDTPETDDALYTRSVPAELARRLERERDEARKIAEKLRKERFEARKFASALHEDQILLLMENAKLRDERDEARKEAARWRDAWLNENRMSLINSKLPWEEGK
jgi:hypothetical protein